MSFGMRAPVAQARGVVQDRSMCCVSAPRNAPSRQAGAQDRTLQADSRTTSASRVPTPRTPQNQTSV